jgi:polysaccharide biosynthesis protein PslE
MSPAEPSLSLRKAGHALFRHKRKMALFVLLVMGAAATVIALMPRAYRSQAKLLVLLGRENAVLGPTATFGQAPVVAVPPSRENDINSALEILTSRYLAEQVVDSVGPAAILGRAAPAPSGQGPGADAGPDRHRAIVKFTRKLEVEAVKKSNVIAIRYDGPSPEVAQAVVSRLTDCYLQRYAHLHRTSGAHRFLSEQAARLRAQLTRTEEELRDLKDRSGLFHPEGQRLALTTRVGQFETDLVQTAAAVAAAEAEVKVLRARMAETPKTQVTARTSGFPNQVADLMRGQLYTLRLKEIDLLGRHPEAHPEVRLVRNQLATAREAVDREERQRDQVTTGPNRAYEEGQIALVRQEAALASLRARADELRRQRDREQAALRALNRDELPVARLQRELDLQTAQYRKYAENLEQAEIDRGLEAERISNVNVVQPATYEVEPVRPKPLPYLGIALAVALLGSLALAGLAEKLDDSLKAPDEVEAVLGLPVLAAVPRRRPWLAPANGKGLPT